MALEICYIKVFHIKILTEKAFHRKSVLQKKTFIDKNYSNRENALYWNFLDQISITDADFNTEK